MINHRNSAGLTNKMVALKAKSLSDSSINCLIRTLCKIFRMFKKFSKTMEKIVNKTEEDIRVEMRKLKTEMTKLKNLLGKIISYWKASPPE